VQRGADFVAKFASSIVNDAFSRSQISAVDGLVDENSNSHGILTWNSSNSKGVWAKIENKNIRVLIFCVLFEESLHALHAFENSDHMISIYFRYNIVVCDLNFHISDKFSVLSV